MRKARKAEPGHHVVCLRIKTAEYEALNRIKTHTNKTVSEILREAVTGIIVHYGELIEQ